MSHDHTSLGRVASSSGRGATCRSWLRRSRTSWAASRSRYIVRGAHRSASRRTWSLYSAVNRRRTARSRTSGSGTVGGGTTRSGAVAPFTIAGLGASGTPSWPAGGARRRAFGFFALAMTETPLPALYSNFGGGRCLTIIGTEGARRPRRAPAGRPRGDISYISSELGSPPDSCRASLSKFRDPHHLSATLPSREATPRSPAGIVHGRSADYLGAPVPPSRSAAAEVVVDPAGMCRSEVGPQWSMRQSSASRQSYPIPGLCHPQAERKRPSAGESAALACAERCPIGYQHDFWRPGHSGASKGSNASASRTSINSPI